MATDLVPKSSAIYECKICDYLTSRHSQYNRHILTLKHINATNSNKYKPCIVHYIKERN